MNKPENMDWAVKKLADALLILGECTAYSHPQGSGGLDLVREKICLCLGWLMAHSEERKIISHEKNE